MSFVNCQCQNAIDILYYIPDGCARTWIALEISTDPAAETGEGGARSLTIRGCSYNITIPIRRVYDLCALWASRGV